MIYLICSQNIEIFIITILKKCENGSNRHLTKRNHNKKSICCRPKNALLRDLVKKPVLDIGKKI